ncbi:MAG: DUF637 domain-containing protein, partial [Alphaproteobacteria bacterium]
MARADITVGYTMFMFLKFNMIKLFIFILAIFLHTLANARVLVPAEEITAAKAGVQAVAASTVVGTVNHQGNVFKAVEDLGKPEGLKSIALAGLTGGLVDGASLKLGIPKQPQTLTGHFQKAAVKGLASGTVNATLGGQTFEKALLSGATTFAADTMGGVASQHLGEARLEGLGFLEHKLAHGLVGAATGAILNPDDPGRGALAGALGQAMAETLAEWQLGVPEMLAKKSSLK